MPAPAANVQNIKLKMPQGSQDCIQQEWKKKKTPQQGPQQEKTKPQKRVESITW